MPAFAGTTKTDFEIGSSVEPHAKKAQQQQGEHSLGKRPLLEPSAPITTSMTIAERDAKSARSPYRPSKLLP